MLMFYITLELQIVKRKNINAISIEKFLSQNKTGSIDLTETPDVTV